MKNFCFETICNITKEPQELQRFNCACWLIGKSAVIKHHRLLLKVIKVLTRNRISISLIATASSFTRS